MSKKKKSEHEMPASREIGNEEQAMENLKYQNHANRSLGWVACKPKNFGERFERIEIILRSKWR